MNVRGAGGVTSTPTTTDVVLSAALSVEAAETPVLAHPSLRWT